MSKCMKLDYGSSVLSLPKERLLTAIPEASGFDLKVLILIASNESLRSDYDSCCNEICKQLDCTKSALEKSISFWCEASILSCGDSPKTTAAHPAAPIVNTEPKIEATPTNDTAKANADKSKSEPESEKNSSEPEKKSKVLMAQQLPSYSESTCADIIENTPELSDVINMCQQIMGKIFTPADTAVVVSLYDHLGLSGEYIVSLFNYCCVNNGKKAIRYIEKTALNLFDEGIDSFDAFNEYLKRQEERKGAIPEIRKMLGLGSRELTPKETKTFECWLDKWNYSMAIIRRAWEITIGNIKEPSISYMDKVLGNWHKSGFTTLEDIEAAEEKYKKNKQNPAHSTQTVNGTESGFQTDEFFEAALRRSYKE
ncbi:MAG: DnaD domain protein [Clostridiales bacterium]|nr:DnaD domain protein [Clostridiales bacterium]